jgi:hypothetical protein
MRLTVTLPPTFAHDIYFMRMSVRLLTGVHVTHINGLVLQVNDKAKVSPAKVLQLVESLVLPAVTDSMERYYEVQQQDANATPDCPVMLLLLGNTRFKELAQAYVAQRRTGVSNPTTNALHMLSWT